MLKLPGKTEHFRLKMKKIVIWRKHACQNMVAMETTKLIDRED